MDSSQSPVVVMPPVYELSFGGWRWCKLAEACAVVPRIARIAGADFAPTPDELVSKFALLVRPNGWPSVIEGERRDKKRIFRYALNTLKLEFQDVPYPCKDELLHTFPPFKLDLETPYPEGMFVREDWVLDTLKVIRCGVVQLGFVGGVLRGFVPHLKKIIFLDEIVGKQEPLS